MDIKVLIVEDNPITSLDIKEILEGHGMIVTGVASNSKEAIKLAKLSQPDVVLMDIQLDGELDGISVAQELNTISITSIIYLTANSDNDHKLKAFKTSPSGFLTKPFNKTDLLNSIELSFVNGKNSKIDPSLSRINEFLFLKMGERYEKVAVDDILLIEADGSYSRVVTKSKVFSLALNLHTVSEKINNPVLLRIHRSSIVNVNSISSFDGHYVYIDQKAISYSKNYKEELMRYLHKV